jgi:hypothetical protein
VSDLRRDDPPGDPLGDEANPFAEGLVSATQAELRKLGSLDTMLGQQVLIIARGMARGQGSELATLSKEHSRLMANIAAGNTVADDPVADADDAVKRKLARAAQA